MYMILRILKRKFPKVLGNLIRLFVEINQAFATDNSRPYTKAVVEINNKSAIDDTALALMAHVVGEILPSTIIEIGAYSGSRICEIKRLFPALDAFALDIGKSYEAPFEQYGVKFRPFELTFFNNDLNNALVFSVGTLTCMNAHEVEALFDTLRHRKSSVALFEPYPLFNLSESIVRFKKKGYTTYYHPYELWLEDTGYIIINDPSLTKRWYGHVYNTECSRLVVAALPNHAKSDERGHDGPS
jgi:hypothetical protein